jgi:hypothetical protein
MEDEKPSTKHLVLKPKEIVPMDPPSRPGDGTALSVQLIHEQNRLAEEKAKVRRRTNAPMPVPETQEPGLSPAFKLKTIDTVNPVARPDDEEAIHVAEILLENRINEERSGWKRIRFWRRRRSKRLRDFLIGVGSVDLAVAAFMYWQQNPITAMFGIGAITLVTSMSAWIMFFVMDDY